MAELGEKIILGIDPGTNIMGYGLILCKGNNAELIDLGTVQLTKIKDPFEKLKHIFDDTCSLIKKYGPHEMAIEDPFFGKNVQSMLKLGRAQGVVIAAAINNNLGVHQYSPRKIKQSITGNGNASKEQVAAMIQRIMPGGVSKHFDATDGLAVAICHHYQNGNMSTSTSKRQNSWAGFISQNPGRVVDLSKKEE